MTLDVARLHELRGWTPDAMQRLGVTIDGDLVVFPVRDETGELLSHERYQPDPARRNGDPKMLAEYGAERHLFPPPELIADDEPADGLLWIVEGHADAMRLWSLGLTAVAVPGTSNWHDEWAERFIRPAWRLVVCCDCDEPGRKLAERVVSALHERGADVRLLDLDPQRDDGYDLTDLLAVAATGDERAQAVELLRTISAALPPYEVPDQTVTFTQFSAKEGEKREQLVTGAQGTIAAACGLVVLVAKTGDGKTTFTIELVLHASTGRDYLGLSFPRPLNVLVIENEGPREAFREKLAGRLATWQHGGEPRIWDDEGAWGQVRLSDPETRRALRAVIEARKIDLVVSDSLTRFGVRGNGTPEETRDFVAWLTELGLGRDVAFMLLHHPRTRTDPGEDELERIAGAWPPHADTILLLKRLDGERARLSFPKTRWAKSQRPASILAFDPVTESFTHVSEDVPLERDLVSELAQLMVDGDWWAVNALRKPKAEGGVGAGPDPIKSALTDELFEDVIGAAIGRRYDATYYRLKEASRPPRDGRDASTPQASKEQQASPVFSRKGETLADDASFNLVEASRAPETLAAETLLDQGEIAPLDDGSGETCRRCGNTLRRGTGNRGDLCGKCTQHDADDPSAGGSEP